MTIQQLSQEVGIGIDTLRIWERRYGFPVPGRDSRGHRRYSTEQVEELRIVKKLQSAGHRPGKIFALSAAERRQLVKEIISGDLPENLSLQRLASELAPAEIDREMQTQLLQLGLPDFVHQFALPLLQVLDRGWTEGRISIAREHLISDRLENLLKGQLVASQRSEKKEQILFLTLSGERHKLGLLLAAALFHHHGIGCLLLQEELPLSEVPELAAELGVAAVALSFSAHYSARQAKKDLASLRNSLNPEIKLIAGGDAVQAGVRMQNLFICTSLEQIPGLCKKHFAKARRDDGR